MDNALTNPYQAPTAEVVDRSGAGLGAVVPRFSAWAVFGLSCITLGIYGSYWLYTRTRRINAHVNNPIGKGFMITTLVLLGCSWLGNFIMQIDPRLGAVLILAGLVCNVMFIVWAFRLRNRLHQLQGLTKRDPLWAGPILTFFFNVIYLQYKINQSIDRNVRG